MMDTEENILAAALLWWLADSTDGLPGWGLSLPAQWLVERVNDRYASLGCPSDLAVLVADCERRYAVEKCEREVLEAADAQTSAEAEVLNFRPGEPLGSGMVRYSRACARTCAAADALQSAREAL